MKISMIALNEEKFVDPCISDMHDEDWIEEIIVIDGGSSDNTRLRLKQYPKVKVYVHPYPKYYHDAQIMQRNIQLTYHRIGEIFFIMDFDEKMSDDLKKYLKVIDSLPSMTEKDLICVSRISFESMREIESPYAILTADGWPVTAQQIGQYPDYQPRLIKRKVGMTWVNSPHHSLVAPGEIKTVTVPNTDIIHYHGKFDARDRENIEILWAGTQARRRMLGLTCDTFDATLSPELSKYADPETWAKIWSEG